MVLALILGLSPQPTQAAGEQYSWKSEGDSTITATGGAFGATTATFTRISETNGATYTYSGPYTCANQAQTAPLTLTIGPEDYKKVNPPRGTITGAPSPPCNLTSAIVQVTNANPVTGVPDSANKDSIKCDQGSFSWLFCPAIDNLAGTISNLAKGVLEPMLVVKPINPTNTPELYKTWGHIRDFTEVLMILVFLLIIAGELLKLDLSFFDQYTVKKVLPRLVIAAVLVQFSFLIASLIVDFGNVLGGGISNLLVAVTQPESGPANFSNVVSNLVVDSVLAVTGIGAVAVVLLSWTVALPILLSLLLSLLVVFLVLGARYLLIAILIAGAPLAMLAWVLPNTRDFCNDWFKLFFRLVMMYPLVIGIISLAGIVNQLLPFSKETADGAAGVAAWLIKPLIVIAAFLIVPFTFKLAGKALTRGYAFLNGASQRSKGWLKGSDMWQRGVAERQRRQNALMGRVLNSKSVTSLQNKGGLGRGAAGLMGAGAALALLNAPKSKQALQRSNSSLLAATKKQIEELDESWVPSNLSNALTAKQGATAQERAKAKAAIMRDAPDLWRYAQTPLGQRAIKQVAFDRGFGTEKMISQPLRSDVKASPLRVANGNLAAEGMADIAAVQSKRKEMPAVVLRTTKASTNYEYKDGSGNVRRVLPREIGDADMTTIAKVYRGHNAASLQDTSKHSLENFAVMRQTTDTSLSQKERDYGRDTYEAFLDGFHTDEMVKMFKVDPRMVNRNYETRLQLLQAMQANHQFASNPAYRAHYDIATSSLASDEKVVNDLAMKAGLTPMFDTYTTQAKAAIVRDWITKGETFDPGKAYEQIGADYEKTKRVNEMAARKASKLKQNASQNEATQVARDTLDRERQAVADEATRLRNQPPGGSPNPGP